MTHRRVLLAISGGIAAYKIPDLVRLLRKEEHEVRCVLTASAAEFVSPLVLQTLSGNSVRTKLFDPAEEGSIDHIALADWAEVIVVAPATANLMAKMAHGLADDLVSTLLLATRAKVLVAPAMNVNMWDHAATQANVALLSERGVEMIGPEKGWLACGWEGDGRMSEPTAIAEAIEVALTPPSLEGEVVLVTASGTHEPIDAVRSITNRSSGKMGYAIAAEAARRGAEVVLVSGPSALPAPAGVERIAVETALKMRDVVLEHFEQASIVIKAAADSDFRPEETQSNKIKKEDLGEGESLRLTLVPNPDILAELCQNKGDRFVVGFAAESQDLIESARRKIVRKGCDLMVANDISCSEAGFDVDTNAVVFVKPGGEIEELPMLSKREVAAQLLDRVEKMKGEQS